MALALSLSALAGGAAAQVECTLTVEPEVAVAGSEFQLHGEGYTPTQLVLQKDGAEAVTIDLDLAGQDPFEIPVGSSIGDEGVWQATAELPGTCSPSVTFTVTLQDTDAMSDVLEPSTTEGRLPVAIYLLIIAVGLGGGVLAGARLRLAPLG